MDETTNSHVNIDNTEIELLLIASIETLKHQNKSDGFCKDEVFALVKNCLEEAITKESFEKSLELLQVSDSMKPNITSNRICLSIYKRVQFLKLVLKILRA